jgi:hypothetical protein
MKKALCRAFTKAGGEEQDWDQISQFIMDFFGYEDIVLDNRLTPRDRDIFYMLEGAGLIRTEMEEATLQKGKVWRIHYWKLNFEKIEELLKEDKGTDAEAEGTPEGNVYENMPENGWSRKK